MIFQSNNTSKSVLKTKKLSVKQKIQKTAFTKCNVNEIVSIINPYNRFACE